MKVKSWVVKVIGAPSGSSEYAMVTCSKPSASSFIPVVAMQPGWIGKIARAEAHRLVLEILPDQGDLFCIARVVGDHLLDTTTLYPLN